MIEFSNPLYAKKTGDKYAPYADRSEALSLIPKASRKVNMVINIGWIEYEWKYGLNDVDLTKKKDFDPYALTTDEILLLLSVQGGSSGSMPSGTARQVVSFDSQGKVVATRFTADMWSDFSNGAPEDGDWFAAYSATAGQSTLGFFKASWIIEPDSVPLRGQEGQVKVGNALIDQDAVNLAQAKTVASQVIKDKVKDVPFDPNDMDDRITLVALMNALKA